MLDCNQDLAKIVKTLALGGVRKVSATLIQVLFLAIFFSATWVSADQNAEELPALFTQLQDEVDSKAAVAIEERIWQLWLDIPDENSAYLLSQISTAIAMGRYQIALRLSNQLVDSAPDFAEAWNKRATVHYLMKNYAESVADIRETVRLEPRHFGAISGLGMIFMRENNLPAALQAFEQVLQISPASANAKRSIEYVRREMGREI